MSPLQDIYARIAGDTADFCDLIVRKAGRSGAEAPSGHSAEPEPLSRCAEWYRRHGPASPPSRVSVRNAEDGK